MIAEIDASLENALAAGTAQIVHIVREALSNVERHAGATTCRVSILRNASTAVIEIDDDGSGFDVAAASPGMGMGNLADRAELLGGSLEVDSQPGMGTIIRVRVPL